MPNQVQPPLVILGTACWLLCLLVYVLGYRRAARRCDAIRDVPTIAARDIPGLGAAMVEVKGVVEAEAPLISDLALIPCVMFESSVTEHWTTTRVERDSKGNTRTVTEHHSRTLYSNDGMIDFEVRDDSGAVTVRPAGAEIDWLDGMAGLDEPLPESPAYGIRPTHLNGRLSYSEAVLPIGQRVYVLGQVDEDHSIRKPSVVRRPFIISHRSEESLRKRAQWGKRIHGMLLVALFIGGAVLLASGFGVIQD